MMFLCSHLSLKNCTTNSDNFVEALSQIDFCRLAVLFFIVVLMLECSMQLILELPIVIYNNFYIMFFKVIN